MKKNLGTHGKRVIRKVRAVAHKAKKTIMAERELPRPPSELRHTPEQPLLIALRKEGDRLKEEIQRQEVLTQDHPTSGNHMADDASEVFEQTKNLALKRHLEKMLEQVELAMRRIEKGTYGVCEKCGGLINPDRLQVIPSATLCMRCASISSRAA
jgi:RNA polymerase-binding transcription factor DksA